jgi:hypothetical protein
VPVAAPVSLPSEPRGAWQDLPNVQRTLAEPLRPVAIGDDFRQSLASFNDPSFVAPLSHHVDPSAGGLVDGLVAPGQPHARSTVSDLPVPARPAAQSAPQVQRSVAWSGSTDLPTVGWELPGLPPDQPVEPTPEPPPVTDSEVEPSAPISAADTMTAPTAPPAAAGPVAAPAQAALPVQRSLASVPTTPERQGVVPPIALGELPVVVARSTPVVSAREMSTPEVQRATPGLPTPPEPVAEQASLSGSVEAITRMGGSAESPTGLAGVDRSGPGPSIQRLAGDVEAPVGLESVSDAGAEITASVASSSLSPGSPSPGSPSPGSPSPATPTAALPTTAALPVVSRLLDPRRTGDPGWAASVGEPLSKTGETARGVEDAPTLGTGLAQKPLAVQRAPLTGRTPPPAEPPVQRVEFLAPEITTAAVPSMSLIPAVAHADPEFIGEARTAAVDGESSSAVVPTPGVSAAPPVQRSLDESGPSVAAESRRTRRSQDAYPVGPAPVQRFAAEGSSNEAVDASAAVTGARESTGDAVPVEPATPIVPPGLPAPTAAHDRPDLAALGGPAISVEPWVGTPAPSAQPTSVPTSVQPTPVQPAPVQRTAVQAPSVRTPSVQRAAAPAPAVQTSPAPAPFSSAAPASPAYPTRPVGSRPAVAVGPPIPVQRTAAHLTEGASNSSSAPTPLIVSRQVAADVPPGGSRTGGNMSFASMFGSPPPAETGAAADGFTSVQLQSADSAAAPSEPAGETAPSAPASSVAPAPAAAGTQATDLDEMARRLYEPLSARLRAELWLDRERAGVMSDA